MSTALSIRNISKRFGAVQALDNVSVDIAAGSFHAIMGENGAGKSTLAKCIMGHYNADEGTLLIHDQPSVVHNPKDAHRHGIGMVYQHFMLVNNMTVAENLTLAREHISFLIDWDKEEKDLSNFMRDMPFRLEPSRLVRDLSAGEKQKLEILKMLYIHCNILMLDEPTSVLTPGEADAVLSFLKQAVVERQLTVIIITHKFREVFGYADTVTVLRKGKYAGGGNVRDFTKGEIAELMVGTRDYRSQTRTDTVGSVEKLKLVNISDYQHGVSVLNECSLHVNSGEIYGIAGVSGNGQKRLVEVLSGQAIHRSGKILINGEEFFPTRAAMQRHHMYCLPEEPLLNACVPEMSIAENMALRYYDLPPYERVGVLRQKKINTRAKQLIEDFSIKASSPRVPIKTLSGGNIQRAVLARELSANAKILVVANPCFGLDFRAIAEVRAMIVAARNGGAAILLISEDLDEIMELSDRIGVMYNGTIVYETGRQEADTKIIGEKMAGS